MITSFKIFESKTQDELYHFTNIFNAISIVDGNYMTSYYGNLSTTRNKNLNKLKPPNVQLGVRFVFDWDKILEDYKTKPFQYSKELKYEEEELIILNNNDKKLENIKKYTISIDIIVDDIQSVDNIGIRLDDDVDDMESFILMDPECEEVDDVWDSGYFLKCKPFGPKGEQMNYKWSPKFFQNCKEYFESKNFKVNIV